MRSITAELRSKNLEIAKRAEEKAQKLEAFKREALNTLKSLLEERGWETSDLDFRICYADLDEARNLKVADIQVQPKGFELVPAAYPAKCRLVFPLEKDPEWTEKTLKALLRALLDPYRWDEIAQSEIKEERIERGWKRWLRNKIWRLIGKRS